jgi:hypothetical protein
MVKGRRRMEFGAVAFGMMVFGLFALPALIKRSGYQ